MRAIFFWSRPSKVYKYPFNDLVLPENIDVALKLDYTSVNPNSINELLKK